MGRSIQTALAAAALALLVPQVQAHQRHEQHPGQVIHAGSYQHANAYERCGAPRWNSRQRYMPGQVVWRQGTLWVAKRISARVWNENSPPEWTPQYWGQAVCGG